MWTNIREVKKGINVEWDEDYQEAFDKIIQSLSSETNSSCATTIGLSLIYTSQSLKQQ